MTQKDNQKFIGFSEIKLVQEIFHEGTEPKEGEQARVLVTYTDGRQDVFTKKMFDIVATEESIDLTTLRELMIKPILTDVLSVLMSWDIRMVDIDYLNQRLIGALEESERISMSKLWKKQAE